MLYQMFRILRKFIPVSDPSLMNCSIVVLHWNQLHHYLADSFTCMLTVVVLTSSSVVIS